MKGKDFLSISDLNADSLHSLIDSAVDIKNKGWLPLLERKILAILFEHPSTRTRVSFEVGMRQLGGQAIYLSQAEVGLGKRESIADVARVLSRYVDAITARTFSHKSVEELARYADVPVINALSDLEHPCQALADLLTVYEKKKRLAGVTLAYIGDGNNVANSLLLAASLAGMSFRIASPPAYSIPEKYLDLARRQAPATGASILCTDEPETAVSGADVVYTDVWTSMGQEAEAEERRRVFKDYQVNKRLMSLAGKEAIFMHPLPAHRGEEITGEIMESAQSVVFDQAENRLHAQKALLVRLLGSQRQEVKRK